MNYYFKVAAEVGIAIDNKGNKDEAYMSLGNLNLKHDVTNEQLKFVAASIMNAMFGGNGFEIKPEHLTVVTEKEYLENTEE
jgi:hypothetical protein